VSGDSESSDSVLESVEVDGDVVEMLQEIQLAFKPVKQCFPYTTSYYQRYQS